ncbi:MAG: hypothetical protein J5486_04765 [Bacteroidaceae bacterium]|nr:hypothetical protein [Bacteroidaceae bacterium]
MFNRVHHLQVNKKQLGLFRHPTYNIGRCIKSGINGPMEATGTEFTKKSN